MSLTAPRFDQVVESGGTFSKYWQFWLAELTRQLQLLLNGIQTIYVLSADTAITSEYSGAIVIGTGTTTLTLPDAAASGQKGRSYYFINNDAATITIAGTINGNPAGYSLAAQYDYVQVTSTGTEWLITAVN